MRSDFIVWRPTGAKGEPPYADGWLMSRDYRDSVPVISRIAQNIDVGRNLRLAALDALFDPLPVVVTQS
jgi:hypothetical protein